MRTLRLVSCIALSGAIVLASSSASAQLQPPPPIDPNAQGSPNAPPPGQPGVGQPGQPGMPPAQNSTEADLNTAEQEDSGRAFELFYVNADAGAAYVNMQQFSQDQLAIVKASSGGPMFSLGAGLRLVILYLGARVKWNDTSAFSIWQINGEAGFRFPIKKWDFSIGAHGGYAFLGNLDSGSLDTSTSTSASQVSVNGFNAGADIGADYFLASIFSVGLGMSADFLFLHRPPVALPSDLPAAQQQQLQQDPLYANSGSSAGFGISGGLRLALHLGF